jgi:serine/threonine-protein kinase
MGRIYIQQGLYRPAIEMLLKARSLAGDVPIVLGALGQAYGLDGRPGEARAILAKLEAQSEERYVPSSSMALVHCGLGEKEQALNWLETGCDRRELTITAIGIHPAYDTLRQEPRFTALLKRIGVK